MERNTEMSKDVAALRKVTTKAIMTIARKYAMTVDEVMYVFNCSASVAKFAVG